MKTSVLLVDNNELIRLGYRLVLGSTPDLEVVGEAKTNDEAVELAVRLQPAVILMDTCSPNQEGLGVLRRMRQRVPGSGVLVLTTFDLPEDGMQVLQAGATGFLAKDIPPANLIAAIRSVAAGQVAVSPTVTRALLNRYPSTSDQEWASVPEKARDPLGSLTPREREVFLQLVAGRSNAEIAAEISTTEATVKTHVTRLLSKLDLRDRVQAVIFGYENGVSINEVPPSARSGRQELRHSARQPV